MQQKFSQREEHLIKFLCTFSAALKIPQATVLQGGNNKLIQAFVLEPFFPISRERRVLGPFSVFMAFVAKMALRVAAKCLLKIAQMGPTAMDRS